MAEFYPPSKKLARKVGKALNDFSMIQNGDRILLGVSGGKDSLTLLHLLKHFQRRAPIQFEFAAITVDPQSGDFDPSSLIPYMEALGVTYFYQKEPILELAEEHMGKNSYCAFCSRLKRGIIYSTARQHNYNVIALGQHLDDIAESFLMSAFHGGKLNTMKAHYINDAGDLRIIRPLIYARETLTRSFAHNHQLPVIADSCPACFSMPTQREHMKQLLASQEADNPQLFASLETALKPLIREGFDKVQAHLTLINTEQT